MKAFADIKLNVVQMTGFVSEQLENILGKKEKMLVNSIFFFFFPKCFRKSSVSILVKLWICVVEVKGQF